MTAIIGRIGARRFLTTTALVATLAGCSEQWENFDFDLRDLGDGFDTTAAVANATGRPAPDDRGIISYPGYQVALAQQGDTVSTLSARLGLDAGAVARFNGLAADTPLRGEEVIALPSRVAEPSPATGAVGTGPIQPLDVTQVATTALDRVDAASAPQTGAEPIRYQVGRGETAFSIARQFNITAENLAAWNSLGSDLAVREGQFLLIPQGTTPAPLSAAPASEPGSGSTTPLPPSAATPLPADTTATPAPAAPAAPNLVDAPSTAAEAPPPAPEPDSAQMVRPVTGSIIRAFAPDNSNEGIDIGVAAGTSVQAADAGTVAAVTEDTSGTAIVVIKHADNLLTLYTNLTDLTVAKNDTVTRGQPIAKVAPGDPSFLHFEVRRGLQAADPEDFLP